jgi:hypothetical protein
MNENVTGGRDAATASDEVAALRGRLASAGLLAPAGTPRSRPDVTVLARARRAAGRGTPLSDVVTEERG